MNLEPLNVGPDLAPISEAAEEAEEKSANTPSQLPSHSSSAPSLNVPRPTAATPQNSKSSRSAVDRETARKLEENASQIDSHRIMDSVKLSKERLKLKSADPPRRSSDDRPTSGASASQRDAKPRFRSDRDRRLQASPSPGRQRDVTSSKAPSPTPSSSSTASRDRNRRLPVTPLQGKSHSRSSSDPAPPHQSHSPTPSRRREREERSSSAHSSDSAAVSFLMSTLIKTSILFLFRFGFSKSMSP